VSEAEDVARSREFLRQGVGTTTRRNRVLPAARLPSPIPARVGKAGPREGVGAYVEVDYAMRVLSGQNATTYHYEMLNTPLDGNMRLYLQPRPLDTPAGDSNYYASAVKLTTTDGLLKTDYQLKLKTAIIRPASGDDKLIGIGAAPVTGWFAEFDLVRGPTGVHALVKKAKKVDMLVDGTPETLTLKPPPYTKPAGNGLCVLDEILKLGDPWHGLIQGGTLRLPGGKTRPVARPGIGAGVVYPLIPYGVTPAATADAADVAAGRTWLNYGLLAGACLYEQSIASAFPCWVYIAPDNSTWRVSYAHVFIAGVWKLQLQFYPLRRVFLTDDKWGGLAQTIQVAVNPAPWSYTQGLLYDLDSKGAQAIFVNNPYPHQRATGAAYLNIQGIPPAATATYTLVIDAAEPGPSANKLYSPDIVGDYSDMVAWNTVYETFRVEQDQNGDDVKVDVNYVVVNHAAGDFTIPTWPGAPTPFFYVYWYAFTSEGISRNATVVGYAFDAADALQTVWLRIDTNTNYTETRDGDPWDYFLQPKTTTPAGGGYVEYLPRIGQLSGPGAKWDFDGADLGTIQANAYGDFLSFGSGGNAVTAVRYSNRVYGLSLADGANNSAWWRPPMSPDVVSAYPADLHVQAKPFGTYQPITKLFAWETGFVNFV
jgi:hypothetical protein